MFGVVSFVGRPIAVLMLVVVVGCGGSQEAAQSDGDGNERKGPTIGVSQPTLKDPLQQQIKVDITAAAKRRPDLGILFRDAEGDPAKQQAHVREFIEQGVRLIILTPGDPVPLTDPVSEAIKANVPVVLLHRSVFGDQYTCLLRVDDEKIGAAAGSWVAKRYAGQGAIVELKGKAGSREADALHRGFRSALKGQQFRSFFEANMDWNEKDAQTAMEEALIRHDRIAAVFAHSDLAARAAYSVAKQARREKEILFIGVGALPHEGVAYVKQGILDASFECPPAGPRQSTRRGRSFEERRSPRASR